MCSQYVFQDFTVAAISVSGNLSVLQSTKVKFMAVCIIFRTRTNPGVHRCKKNQFKDNFGLERKWENTAFYVYNNVQNVEHNFHYSVSRKTQSRNREKKRHICFLKMIFTDNQIISYYILINFLPCIQSDILVYFEFLDFLIEGHILGQLYGQWVVPRQLKIIEGLSPFPPSPGPAEWINCHGWEDNRCVWKNGAVLYFYRSLPKTQRVTIYLTIISALFWRT